jgi:hypothetical protein
MMGAPESKGNRSTMPSKRSLLLPAIIAPRTVSGRHDDNDIDDELLDEADSDHDVENEEEVEPRRLPDERQRHHANKPGDIDCPNEPVRTLCKHSLNDRSSLFPPLTASVC